MTKGIKNILSDQVQITRSALSSQYEQLYHSGRYLVAL